jgi:hypothetical protein
LIHDEIAFLGQRTVFHLGFWITPAMQADHLAQQFVLFATPRFNGLARRSASQLSASFPAFPSIKKIGTRMIVPNVTVPRPFQ